MKKIIISFVITSLLITLLALSLTGCGGKPENTGTESDSEVTSAVTVSDTSEVTESVEVYEIKVDSTIEESESAVGVEEYIEVPVDEGAESGVNEAADSISASQIDDTQSSSSSSSSSSTASKDACIHVYTATTVKKPTCTENGTEKFICSKCGYSYVKDIASSGHSFDSSGVCSRCGEKQNKESYELPIF